MGFHSRLCITGFSHSDHVDDLYIVVAFSICNHCVYQIGRLCAGMADHNAVAGFNKLHCLFGSGELRFIFVFPTHGRYLPLLFCDFCDIFRKFLLHCEVALTGDHDSLSLRGTCAVHGLCAVSDSGCAEC